MIKHLFSFVKFSHTIFAMPFAVTSFFYAWHDMQTNEFPWRVLLLIVLCMVFARNAAMGFNRYIDRKYDKKNLRTRNREIPAGIISPKTALVFVIVNGLLFCVTTMFINALAFRLSFVALFTVLGYSYTKRFTALCHFILGIALGIAPAGAYIALTGELAPVAMLLSLLVLFWVGGFDILYALPDCDFDRENRLHSVPAAAGVKNAVILSAAIHVIPAATALLIGFLFDRGLFYWAGCAVFIGLLIYQHAIVSPTNPNRHSAAFGLMNGIASVGYAVFSITDVLLTMNYEL
ncbi:MAG: putative 4-hydroxybenzoate polyprenyltransferase [Prevotellaceae bacterium]|jgi:4-hydroxybenzoate polyprenyltransferase|nr:putative 4-hydroxybenzoate polyprenyltransferase [Prevotellaceae bacterium]